MQTIKKTISILLSLVMILSVFTIAPVRTGAQKQGDWVFTKTFDEQGGRLSINITVPMGMLTYRKRWDTHR